MHAKIKYAVIYLCLLGIVVSMALNLAQAQDNDSGIQVEAVEGLQQDTASPPSGEEPFLLDQAELDQILAPIALYPDTVLSHILVASTYPLEVIQAARWREDNLNLDEDQALEAVEQEDWDPSVKALIPFHELLQQISDDLNWLQDLGDAFLINEEQVLASIQNLRQKAYAQGSLNNNEYIEVVEEENDIVIVPAKREVVYIPYYDTRVVYGDWWWHDRPPYYWHRPAHYYWHAGLYWSPRVYFRHTWFFGGFHWRNRHIVVNHHYPKRHYYYEDGIRRVKSREYQRWHHNPHHRKGVRYHRNTPKVVYRHTNASGNKVVRSSEANRQVSRDQRQVVRSQRPAQVRTTVSQQQRQQTVQRTQQSLEKQRVRRDYAEAPRNDKQRNRVRQQDTQKSTQPRRQVSNNSRNQVLQTRQSDRQTATQQNRRMREDVRRTDKTNVRSNQSQRQVTTTQRPTQRVQRQAAPQQRSTQRSQRQSSNVQRSVQRTQSAQRSSNRSSRASAPPRQRMQSVQRHRQPQQRSSGSRNRSSSSQQKQR